jgi:hypothetical protein
MRSTTRMRLEDCAAVSTGRIRFYVATAMRGRVSTLGRVVDAAWPWHPAGRPLIDVARQAETTTQEAQRAA